MMIKIFSYSVCDVVVCYDDHYDDDHYDDDELMFSLSSLMCSW